MSSETIEIVTVDGNAEAYVTRPDDGDHPGVLFFMDAIGLRPRIQDMADRIASWGYAVIVPNLFYRSGSAADLMPKTDLTIPENRQAFFADAMARARSLSAEQVVDDLRTYIETLQSLPGVSGDRIGTTGYCMGGRLSFTVSCVFPDLIAASGSFHAGGIVTEGDDSPHLRAVNAKAELYFGHADNDRSMPAEAIATLEATLDETALTYTSVVYEGAAHGYTMADTASYDEVATERHFEALQALLARNLLARNGGAR